MKSNAPLSLNAIFSQAFSLTKSNFFAFMPLILGILVIASFAANHYIGVIDIHSEAGILKLQQKANVLIIVSIILTPIEIGFMLMGVKAARGLPLRSSDILAILPDSPKIIILGAISYVFTQLGMALFIIPGLFLLAMISMAQPLMVDYRLSMVEAVKRSMLTCYQHAGLVIQMFTLLFILILLSFFTFGIALLLTIPFYVNAKGILYCQLFDNEPTAQSQE